MTSLTPMTKRSIAIIGAGMAGARLVKSLVDNGCEASITLIGEEPENAYNRIQLSSVLAGNKSLDELPLLKEQWYQENNIKCHLGDPVVSIFSETTKDSPTTTYSQTTTYPQTTGPSEHSGQKHTIITQSGWQQDFDKLIISTGSTPFIPQLPGCNLKGVMAFRTIKDITTMQQFVSQTNQASGKVVVIGGGLLGLEAAYGLNRQGSEVTVIHNADNLMNRQLDNQAAELLQHQLTAQGINIYTNAKVTTINGETSVTGVELTQKTSGKKVTLDAQLCIFATGITPNVAQFKDTELAINRGILVNDQLETSVPGIYALGECCEHQGQTVGIVAPIWDQVEVLTKTLMGQAARYQPGTYATQLKVSGIDVFSAGEISEVVGNNGQNDAENNLQNTLQKNVQNIVLNDRHSGVYRRLVIENNQLKAAMLFGDKRHSLDYEKLINSGTPLQCDSQALMFSGAAAL